jgi:undecaprenyl-diphosphatase
MSVWEAIILGIVQGLAEFLPISSSGHLQIAKEVLGVELTDNLAFDIMLHVATVLATIVVLWKEVRKVLTGFVPLKRDALDGHFHFDRYNRNTAYLLKLLLSAVPVAVVGLLLRNQLNAMLSSPHILLIVGSMLVVTAGLLVFANFARERTGKVGMKSSKSNDAALNRQPGRTVERYGKTLSGQGSKSDDISWRDAFIIGLAQAVAAMPGLSRSGTTIATGLLLGNKKAAVAQFSFLMIIVPILGEAFLDLVRSGGDFVRPSGGVFGLSLDGGAVFPYIAGFATAFTVGCLACKFMIEMVKRSKLVWFALYCAVVGVGTIVYYFVW